MGAAERRGEDAANAAEHEVSVCLTRFVNILYLRGAKGNKKLISAHTPSIQADLDAIQQIAIVPTMLEVICRTTGMGFAAIARVTEDKWIACSVKDEILFGLLPGEELELRTTICNEIRQSHQAVVIDHVAADVVFRDHHTPAQYGFQSYISVPILRRDGSFFGTLCAIDPKPMELSKPETISMFKLYAELISFHLNAIEELASSQENLREEKQNAELREQFIAVLGHDLRNPLGAVSSGAQILLQMPIENTALRVANIIKESAYRMDGLITNVLDFARGRLGGGITLSRNANEPMEAILHQIITEMRVLWKDRVIVTDFELKQPVNADGKRIAQLFSNLLGNALSYGRPESPVLVRASSDAQQFTLAISNEGPEIPPAIRERLFKPFSRAGVSKDHQGLGLGLYIASEIAAAHGGSIDVQSDAGKTTFTLKIPNN